MLIRGGLVVSAIFLFFTALTAQAGDPGSVRIIYPSDDAALSVSGENYVKYEFTKGDEGDHIHIWIDGEKSPAQRATNGSYELPKISSGKHAIIAKLVNKAHIPVGPEKSIFVTVK